MKRSADRVNTYSQARADYGIPRRLRRIQKQQSRAKLVEFRNPCSMSQVVMISALVLTAYIAHQLTFLFHAKGRQ